MDLYKLPISVKGIVFEGNFVWLRKNERDEWELPGGKIEEGEQPTDTVVRELREELGFEVEVVKIIHGWIYRIKKSQYEASGVMILSYLCRFYRKLAALKLKAKREKQNLKSSE